MRQWDNRKFSWWPRFDAFAIGAWVFCILFVSVVVIFVFAAFDKWLGREDAAVCLAESREYRPAWTQVIVHHSENSAWTQVIHHPESWWLHFRFSDGDDGAVEIDRSVYDGVRFGDSYSVRYSYGRWTDARYPISAVRAAQLPERKSVTGQQ